MKALSNLKVLDFTTLLPGPYATMMLADLGAEVVKVSAPGKSDLILDHEPYVAGTNIGANELWLGRNKKNIFLNLKNPEAVRVVKELVKEYDIVIEQFRAGVMDKLGLGYEELKKENPGLIYCSLTGYGQYGPRAKSAGHDNNFAALSGNLAMLGYKETGPAPMNLQLGDICGGANNAVISILAAVNQRTLTGEGQYIDVAMLDGLIPLTTMDGTKFLATGEETGREDSRFNGGSVYGFYETKDGEYYSVGALEPKFWEIFCNTIGCPELIEGTSEPENLEEVKAKVKTAMKTKTKAEWVEIFSPLDCCVEPVLTLKEALDEDEHIQARGMVVEVEVPGSGGQKVRQLGSQFKLSASPVTYDMGGYPLGYHTKEVMEEMGFDYEALTEAGVFK